eukprot:366474-Chlamydomonas_euryale.AAC.10
MGDTANPADQPTDPACPAAAGDTCACAAAASAAAFAIAAACAADTAAAASSGVVCTPRSNVRALPKRAAVSSSCAARRTHHQ